MIQEIFTLSYSKSEILFVKEYAKAIPVPIGAIDIKETYLQCIHNWLKALKNMGNA